MPVVQIKPAAEFYDYEAKYNRDDTEYLLQPMIDTATYAEVQCIALKVFKFWVAVIMVGLILLLMKFSARSF